MEVEGGSLEGNMPYVAFGNGPPLVVVSGLTAEHTNPSGIDRLFRVRAMRPLANRYSVYLVNRRPGLDPDTSMSDLANHYADAIRARFVDPVRVIGISTGGSVALQLAIDHPDLVERLVVVCAAFRLSDEGRRVQNELGQLIAAGKGRRAWAGFGSSMASSALGQRLVAGMMWIVGGGMSPDDPMDMVRTIAAEEEFDAADGLHLIEAPTLVVGGVRDSLYSVDLLTETAAGIPQADLVVIRGAGHLGASRSGPTSKSVLDFLGTG